MGRERGRCFLLLQSWDELKKKMKVLFALLLFALVCSVLSEGNKIATFFGSQRLRSNKIEEEDIDKKIKRIIGGSNAASGQFPYQVAIFNLQVTSQNKFSPKNYHPFFLLP